jgi:hypothetical protein
MRMPSPLGPEKFHLLDFFTNTADQDLQVCVCGCGCGCSWVAVDKAYSIRDSLYLIVLYYIISYI